MSSTNPTPPAETVEEAAKKYCKGRAKYPGYASMAFEAGSNWKETQLSEEAKALREVLKQVQKEVLTAAIHSNPVLIGKHILKAKDILDQALTNP